MSATETYIPYKVKDISLAEWGRKEIQMAEAVGHNWSDKENRVTHYDMKLENGTVLENVAFEDIQVTNASLAQEHKHAAKRHAKDEEELDESNNDDLVSEVLRRVVARLSNK